MFMTKPLAVGPTGPAGAGGALPGGADSVIGIDVRFNGAIDRATVVRPDRTERVQPDRVSIIAASERFATPPGIEVVVVQPASKDGAYVRPLHRRGSNTTPCRG